MKMVLEGEGVGEHLHPVGVGTELEKWNDQVDRIGLKEEAPVEPNNVPIHRPPDPLVYPSAPPPCTTAANNLSGSQSVRILCREGRFESYTVSFINDSIGQIMTSALKIDCRWYLCLVCHPNAPAVYCISCWWFSNECELLLSKPIKLTSDNFKWQ